MKATIMKNTPLSAFNNFEDISLPSGMNSITRRILKIRSDLKAETRTSNLNFPKLEKFLSSLQ